MPGKMLNLLLALNLLAVQRLCAQDSAPTIAPFDSAAIQMTQPFRLDTSVTPVTGSSFSVAEKPAPNRREPIVSKPLSFRSVVVPTAMIAVGAYTLTSDRLKDVNLSLQGKIWGSDGNKTTKLDDYSKLFPAFAVYGLNLVGVKGKHNLLDRSALLGMASLVGGGIVASSKRIFDVVRPDSSNTLSFPSGHTAQAFISAEFMRQEYKHLSPWYGVAGYAAAIGTGFLRMYNNKHWLNDVIAGAGIGILSTRVSYWLYPKIKNVFTKDRKSSTIVMPTYQNGAVGFGLVHKF